MERGGGWSDTLLVIKYKVWKTDLFTGYVFYNESVVVSLHCCQYPRKKVALSTLIPYWVTLCVCVRV